MRNDKSTVRSNRVECRGVSRLSARGNGVRAARRQIEAGKKPEHDGYRDRPGRNRCPRATRGRRFARCARTRRLVAAGFRGGTAYQAELSRSPGRRTHHGVARQRICARFPPHLCDRAWARSQRITRRFKAEAAAVTEKTELAFPMPVPERGVPAGAVVLLGVVLAVGAYVGWYHLSGEGKLPAETSTQIPTRLAPLAEQAVPPSAPPPASAAAAPTPTTAPTGPMQLVTVDPPPVPAVSPSSAAAAPLPPPIAASADQPRIVLRASADAWVQVRDRSGPVLLNRILHAGDTWVSRRRRTCC